MLQPWHQSTDRREDLRADPEAGRSDTNSYSTLSSALASPRLEMETYHGQVRTPQDAIILFEACRLGLLPRVQRRLSEKERQAIRSGSVFVWDEREAGMRRWTDGKSWSASRVSGSFLTYREMEGKRGSAGVSGGRGSKMSDNGRSSADDTSQQDPEEGPDGYRYKPDGLMKQSFSITTSQGQHLHLISYYSRAHPTAPGLRQPTTDPSLSQIQPQKGMYPETTINDQSNVPPVTQGPMAGAPGYAMAAYARQATHPQNYMPPYPPYGYPHHMHYPGYPPHYPHGLPPPFMPPYGLPINQPPPGAYDQRPIRTPDADRGPPSSFGPTARSPTSATPTNGPPTSGYPQSPFQPAPPKMESVESPRQPSTLQIDPALTGPPSEPSIPDQRPPTNGSTSIPTSQPPSLDTLVNGQSAEHPSPNDDKENSTTTMTTAPTNHASLPAPINTQITKPLPSDTANTTAPASASAATTTDTNRDATLSPTSGAPPQDIPSEKLGFREDSRALRQLDKVFGVRPST